MLANIFLGLVVSFIIFVVLYCFFTPTPKKYRSSLEFFHTVSDKQGLPNSASLTRQAYTHAFMLHFDGEDIFIDKTISSDKHVACRTAKEILYEIYGDKIKEIHIEKKYNILDELIISISFKEE